MENVGFFCPWLFFENIFVSGFSCAAMFLFSCFLGFFFFAVQAWGDCYNLCLVDGQLEKYLELDTLCPG